MLTGFISFEVRERQSNARRLCKVLQRSFCSFPACSNVGINRLDYSGKRITRFHYLVAYWHSSNFLPLHLMCRYDAYAKKLEHINPLPQELLESLDGELDFLGPYPFLLVITFPKFAVSL